MLRLIAIPCTSSLSCGGANKVKCIRPPRRQWKKRTMAATDEGKVYGDEGAVNEKGSSWENIKKWPYSLEGWEVAPLDENNVKLLDNVHPYEWKNPEPAGKYNLVVIGAGASGLVSAAGAAGVGARVALVESELMGGDCLNVGCVPSKALIRCARAVHQAQNSSAYGVKVTGNVTSDFGTVMERMRRLRAQISHVDSAQRFSDLGVDVYQGRASFTGPGTVEVNGTSLNFAAAIIATGGRASVPPIKGLKDVPYLTNATVFNLTELPKRLGVIGGGPIGMELAQCFNRFGSEVTLIDVADQVLVKEERDAADIVYKACLAEGMDFRLSANIQQVSQTRSSEIEIAMENGGNQETLVVDALLVATGRAPNVENMGLEQAGVEFDPRKGITVNDSLQTTNKKIFAVGDVSTFYKFTHVGDFMARIAIRNALFYGRQKFSSLLIPWATYTEPEIAHVGEYESDLNARGIVFDTYQRDFKDVDRAILEGVQEGYVRIFTRGGSDEILGATIVAENAGDMISEITVAMQHRIGLGALASVIHPYPTQAEAIRQCGDQYNKTRLTKQVKAVFKKLMAWRRK